MNRGGFGTLSRRWMRSWAWRRNPSCSYCLMQKVEVLRCLKSVSATQCVEIYSKAELDM